MFIVAAYSIPSLSTEKKGSKSQIRPKAKFATFEEAIAHAKLASKHSVKSNHAADDFEGPNGPIMYVHGPMHIKRFVVFNENDYEAMWDWLLGSIYAAQGYENPRKYMQPYIAI